MTGSHDRVIVAGAGPVGLTVALKLARAGVPVTVVDASPEIIQSPRAIVYHSPTIEALAELGLFEDLRAVGVLKQDYQWRTIDGAILAAIDMSILEPGDTPFPYNLHLGQNTLAAIILKHLLRVPGVEVLWNHRVVGVAQDGAGVDVTVETEDGPTHLRGAWLVGADGAGSGVRAALGLSLEGVTWPEWFVATNIRYDFQQYGWAKANFLVDPDHWAIIPQISEDLWRLTYGEPGHLDRSLLRERLADKLAVLLPGRDPKEPEAFSPYRVHNRCAERFRVGRALLAGDAAHVNNPIGGLGLTNGLLDAVALGNALVDVIAEDAGEELLDLYAADRRRIFLEVVSPASTENKRRLTERDPERRRADRERFARLNTDAALARDVFLFTFKLVGTPRLTSNGAKEPIGARRIHGSPS